MKLLLLLFERNKDKFIYIYTHTYILKINFVYVQPKIQVSLDIQQNRPEYKSRWIMGLFVLNNQSKIF